MLKRTARERSVPPVVHCRILCEQGRLDFCEQAPLNLSQCSRTPRLETTLRSTCPRQSVPDDAVVGWHDIMGASSDPSVVPADESAETPKNYSLFMVVVEYETKDIKAEAVTKGLDATQGEFHRQ